MLVSNCSFLLTKVTPNSFNNGYQKTGVYDGVAVRALITQENVGTVCPDIDQAAYVKGVK